MTQIHHCDDAGRFLQYLRPTEDRWSHGDSVAPWLFRGVEDANYDLTPSAWRPGSDERPLFRCVRSELEQHRDAAWERIVQGDYFEGLWRYDESWERRAGLKRSSSRERLLEHILGFATELECVHRFAELSDELGFALPVEDLVSGSDFLLGTHVHRESVGISTSGGPDLEIPFTSRLAQHHGVPTRLLDWTRDPLVAAYFAIPDAKVEDDSRVAVWALDVSKARRTAFERKALRVRMMDLTLPRHMSSFVHGQSGVFSVLDGADYFFVSEGKWPRMEEVCADALHKITLLRTETPELRRLLWSERRSKPHLMPTLDNVAKNLLDQYRWGLHGGDDKTA